MFTRLTLIYPGRFLASADSIDDKGKKNAFILGVKWEWANDKDLQGLDMKLAGVAVDLCKKKPFPPNCPSDFAEAVKFARAELAREEERQQRQNLPALPKPPTETELKILKGAEIAKRVKAEHPDKTWPELQRLINQAIRESQ